MKSRKGISQSVASIVALAATVMVVAFTLSMHLPNTVFVQRAAVQEAGEAEKLAGVKLSLVALIDGRAIIANDGTAPVTLTKLFTESGEVVLNPPITIRPGEKVSVLVGNAGALAAELEGTGSLKLVLKEKPGLQVATATYTTSCCVTTRYVLTRSTTVYYTTYTPYYVTWTVPTLQTTYSTTTITHKLTQCISCYYGTTSTRTYTSYYYYTPYQANLATATYLTTVVIPKQIGSTTTTSLDTLAVPWTMWYVTKVTTTLPSVTTVTTTYTATATLPTYSTTTYTTTTTSDLRNTLTSTSVSIRPTATTTTTATVTVTTVVVS